MKRMICIVLSVIMAFACLCLTVSAGNAKITQALQLRMDKMDETDKTPVAIFLVCDYDLDDISNQAINESGVSNLNSIDDVHAYRAAYNRILKEYGNQVGKRVIEALELPEEDIVENTHTLIIANLTKADILKASEMNEVESLYTGNDVPIQLPAESESTNGELYLDAFKEQTEYYKKARTYGSSATLTYKELYYSKNTDGETEWALVYAYSPVYGEGPMLLYTVIGNRVFKQHAWYYPFNNYYGIYDVKLGLFIDAHADMSALEKVYPGFTRAFDEYAAKSEYSDNGRLLGDMDGDDELTIIDATLIQRCDVKLRDWPDDDLIDSKGEYTYYKPLKYYSDFDRDGERNVVDATKLQRYVTLID